MTNQIKVQICKLKKSYIYYLTAAVLLTSAVAFAVKLTRETDLGGGDGFLSSISDTSLLFILSAFVSYFIGSDFENRTIQNEIRIGCRRFSAVMSRAFIAVTAAVFLYLAAYTLPFTVILGIANSSFSTGHTLAEAAVKIVLFSLQLAAVLSFTVFFAFAARKSSAGILISVFFAFITCNMLRGYLDETNLIFSMTSFFRIMMNEKILTSGELFISFASAAITIAAMLAASHIVFRRAELK